MNTQDVLKKVKSIFQSVADVIAIITIVGEACDLVETRLSERVKDEDTQKSVDNQ